ncbi:type III-B CRISPR module RAMP protein Cmr1 [Caminibacter sp.]
MDKIVFECESVTPMFMYGADSKIPELRPASTKGVMRFWWRAIHGDLSLEELRKQESEIFGSTERKSKLIIYPIEITYERSCKISPTPHHKKGYCKTSNENCYFKNGKCMKANKKEAKLYKFKIKFALKESNYLNKEQLIELFKITTLLGGFGQRSRRGFGSIQIRKINNEIFQTPNTVDEIKKIIKIINPDFKYTSSINYPYLRNIEIGNKYESRINLLETIGLASHDYDCDALGYAKGKNRLASPIYVSVIKFENKDYRPVISTLNVSNVSNIKEITNFKEAIL